MIWGFHAFENLEQAFGKDTESLKRLVFFVFAFSNGLSDQWIALACWFRAIFSFLSAIWEQETCWASLRVRCSGGQLSAAAGANAHIRRNAQQKKRCELDESPSWRRRGASQCASQRDWRQRSRHLTWPLRRNFRATRDAWPAPGAAWSAYRFIDSMRWSSMKLQSLRSMQRLMILAVPSLKRQPARMRPNFLPSKEIIWKASRWEKTLTKHSQTPASLGQKQTCWCLWVLCQREHVFLPWTFSKCDW